MKIAILGMGNMGSWFAGELARENEIAVFDKDPLAAKRFEDDGRIRILNKLSDLQAFKPHLLLNTVSLQNTIEAFREAEEYLPENCIIADIASTKGEIPGYYRECGHRFASVHPMFGPTFASFESLKKENAIIIKESDSEGAEFFRSFFGKFGLAIFEYSFSEHDAMMAYSLSLPFISSMVFAACMKEKVVPGSTFARHREIADGLLSEDDRLLSEILFNRDSLTQLRKVTSRLEFLKHIIMGRDYEEAKRFFDRLRENIT